MAKNGINMLLEWSFWLAGVLTAVVVADGMINKTLTLSTSWLLWMNQVLPIAGWIVLVSAGVALVSKVMGGK